MAKTKTPPPPPCDWTPRDDGEYYVTDCARMWMSEDGSPEVDGMNYCPYCGRRLRERKAT